MIDVFDYEQATCWGWWRRDILWKDSDGCQPVYI